MSQDNPLGFLPANTCGDQGAYADLTPASWINDDGQRSQAEQDFRMEQESDAQTGVINVGGKTDYSYLDLSRAVYEAAQNLEIVEDDCLEVDDVYDDSEYGEQTRHSTLVKKMGNTLGFTCYRLQYANKDARNSYLPKRDAYDGDDDERRHSEAARQTEGYRKHNGEKKSHRNQNNEWYNKKYRGKSDDSSDTGSDDSTESERYRLDRRNRVKGGVKDTESSSIADFTVDDEELKTFANRRISQIRQSMLDDYDSDTALERSINLDDLGKRAQHLLNLSGSKGRALSMHNVHEAARRS